MTRPAPAPRSVRASMAWWLVAVVAGVVETVIRLFSDDGDIAAQLLVRVVVYWLAVVLILQLRFGRNWARIALTVLLGGIGLFSLLVEPASWLVAGGSPGAFLDGADGVTRMVVVVRGLHVVAVLAGLGCQYTRTANAFFRPHREESRTS